MKIMDKELVCPHCGKDIHTMYSHLLRAIKRHFQTVKKDLNLMNYYLTEELKGKGDK